MTTNTPPLDPFETWRLACAYAKARAGSVAAWTADPETQDRASHAEDQALDALSRHLFGPYDEDPEPDEDTKREHFQEAVEQGWVRP